MFADMLGNLTFDVTYAQKPKLYILHCCPVTLQHY
jgi:hypothetical protein